jgi:hypothetical protein
MRQLSVTADRSFRVQTSEAPRLRRAVFERGRAAHKLFRLSCLSTSAAILSSPNCSVTMKTVFAVLAALVSTATAHYTLPQLIGAHHSGSQ